MRHMERNIIIPLLNWPKKSIEFSVIKIVDYSATNGTVSNDTMVPITVIRLVPIQRYNQMEK